MASGRDFVIDAHILNVFGFHTMERIQQFIAFAAAAEFISLGLAGGQLIGVEQTV